MITYKIFFELLSCSVFSEKEVSDYWWVLFLFLRTMILLKVLYTNLYTYMRFEICSYYGFSRNVIIVYFLMGYEKVWDFENTGLILLYILPWILGRLETLSFDKKIILVGRMAIENDGRGFRSMLALGLGPLSGGRHYQIIQIWGSHRVTGNGEKIRDIWFDTTDVTGETYV